MLVKEIGLLQGEKKIFETTCSKTVIKMEVDESTVNVMASSGATGSVSVLLHPLVVMNISEHWTRVRSQAGVAQQGKLSFVYFIITW